MNILSNNILTYYYDHLDDLPYDKMFHFASRNYLWSQDERAKKLLYGQLKAEFTANGHPEDALQRIVTEVGKNVGHGTKNAAELRQPYFEKYPKLKLYVSLLFRVCFLQTIYGYDVRQVLFSIVPQPEFEAYKTALLSDPEAVAILSTHAINFLYLYERIVKQDDSSLDPKWFLEISQTRYDYNQRIHLQLLIYLLTHCILGESQFYYRKPTTQLETYHSMLQELEKVITEHFDDINLDNKCEYLVCCRLLGESSPLEARIYDEAERSVSTDGTFLVDRHNNNPQLTNATLDLSEHRNVLYILANQPFKPLSVA